MYGLETYLKNTLPSVFPPMAQPIEISICDYETPEFDGVLAEDVSSDLFHCSDAFEWFTVAGFIYYYPALIRNSFINLKNCSAAIDSMIYALN